MVTPRRCRWFGHYWVSSITGNPVDELIVGATAGPSHLRCRRCGYRMDGQAEDTMGIVGAVIERLSRLVGTR